MSTPRPTPRPATSPIDVERLERSIARCGEGRPPRASVPRRTTVSTATGPDDATLVADALGGDERAFAMLHARHRRAVRATVASRVRDRHRVDDVMQEAFLRAFARLDRLRDVASFRPWLLQIARNASIDELRRQLRSSPLDLLDDDAVPDDGDDPAELVEMRLLAVRIGSALARLSTRDRQALVLTSRHGCGPAELAGALGVTPTTAKVVLHRARRRLLAAIA